MEQKMRKNVRRHLVIFISVVLIFAAFAAAQQAGQQDPNQKNTSPKSTHSMDDFINWFHNPAPWLEMGADLRVRWTYGWNLDTMKSNAIKRDSRWNWYQNRMRWWTKTKISDDIDFNLRFTWEFRVWDVPGRKREDHGTDFSEIVWDQFNLTVRNLFDMPLTMVAGRQDIKLGEGWLVNDAGPLDGARTAYFDALRFTYEMPDRDTTVDMIYVENRAAEDAYLKPINDRRRQIMVQDERAVILYLTDKSRSNLQLEGYFIYKNDNPVDFRPTGGPTGADVWPSSWSKKADIYTIGGALSGPIGSSKHWKYRAEGAVQTGKKQTLAGKTPEHTLLAFGTVDRIEYCFNDAKKNKLRGSFEFLSGDKPGTGKNEAFDPLWGEWPRWSEIVNVYAYTLETMVGETTNLYRFGLGHSMQLTEKITMDTDYHLLWADENTRRGFTHSSGLAFSDGGKFRGQLATWCLKYAFSKNLNGHLLLEYFQPGDYYRESSRDAAYFIRVNLDYTF